MEIRREKLKHVLCFAFNKQQHGKSAFDDTVRPRDTRPQTARTLTMHVFELGPKKFEMHVFDKLLLEMHGFFILSQKKFEMHVF